MRPLVLAVVLILPALAGCFHVSPPVPAAAGHGCPKVEGAQPGSILWTIVTNKGTIVAELCAEQAPVTVRHIVNLTTQGKYKGASFYRIVGPSAQSEKGFVIQGGLDKAAGTMPKVADEFHPLLRHDREGVLSIAHAGPGTGSSEFFVTLDKTPHLDDRHAVFGYVVSGLDVVQAIGRAPVEANPNNPQEKSKPTDAITITSVAVSAHPDRVPTVAGVAAYAPIPSRLAEAGDAVNWAVVVRNLGSHIDNFTVTLAGPEGWTTSVDVAKQAIPAGKGAVFLVSALPPAGAETAAYTLTATAKSGRDETKTAAVNLTAQVTDLGALVQNGQRVDANYVGMLTDGRIFDTSLARVADDVNLSKMATSFTYRTTGYTSFNFTVGSGVIPGFTKLALAAHEQETVGGRIAPADAYASGDVYRSPLVGKALIFELQVLKICASATRSEPC